MPRSFAEIDAELTDLSRRMKALRAEIDSLDAPPVATHHADTFAVRAGGYRPILPGEAMEEAAQLLHLLMEEGEHSVVAGIGPFGGPMIVTTMVMSSGLFDRLAAWDATWTELEDVDSDEVCEDEGVVDDDPPVFFPGGSEDVAGAA